MDVFDEELLRIWKSLNSCGVQYIMVGGVATNLHGYQRMTADIDMWVKDTIQNRKNLRKAFIDYGMGDFEAVERIPFIAGWTDFYLDNGLRFDVMASLKGLEGYTFDECLHLASIATIYDVEVPFLHINHLIEAKKATNRPKDNIDVEALEKIKRLRDEKEEDD